MNKPISCKEIMKNDEWIMWGGCFAHESNAFTKGKPKIMKGLIPTLRAQKHSACVILVKSNKWK